MLRSRHVNFCKPVCHFHLRVSRTAGPILQRIRLGSTPTGLPYALMFADLMILLHFVVNSAMKFRNSEGEVANGAPLKSVSFAATLGSASAKLISLLSLSMTAGDVFAGAAIPCQPSA